jgi:hypothetical protein
MYGGLFGDLPPTKKEAKEGKKPSDYGKVASAPVVATTKKAANSSTSFSVIRNLGVSGTAVAFVPTAARRRNVKRPAASNLKTITASKQPAPPTAAHASSVVPTETNNYSSYTPLQEVIKTKEQSLKEAPAVDKTVPESMLDESTLEESRNSSHQPPNENHHRSHDEQRCRQEESLQKQVEEDPYDPLVPNDLLEYWEHQAARRAWEAQQERRRKIERELQQLEPVQKIASRGRGRGGVSNLPAWLVERQRQEAGLGSRLDNED